MVTTCPRIYVASLSDYNAGRLHGAWIDVGGDADALREAIAAMLAASPEPGAEEWAIHGHEGFGSWSPGENPDLDELVAVAAGIEEHGELFAELIAHMGSGFGPEEAASYIADNYQGEYDDLGAWAEEMADQCEELANVPEHIRCHIDWEGVGRDAEMDGDIFSIDMGGRVHVFWSR